MGLSLSLASTGKKRRERARAKFDEEILPNISSLLHHVDADSLFVLYSLFSSTDKDLDGQFSYSEFRKLLGIRRSVISERIYLLIDEDNSGFAGFHEFVNGICHIYTMEESEWCAFVFRIFDLDGRKMLTLAECDALLRMVAGTDHSDHIHLKHINSFCDNEGMVTLANFQKAVSSQTMIIGHLLVVQGNLRTLLGETFSVLKSNKVTTNA
jgi:Ca2+-binding EF-hand superfamily protein